MNRIDLLKTTLTTGITVATLTMFTRTTISLLALKIIVKARNVGCRIHIRRQEIFGCTAEAAIHVRRRLY